VAGTFVTKSDKPVTYLNLGAEYPNSKLTIVIFQKDLINFQFVPSDHYKGMSVCVTGVVKKYKDRFEIISNKQEQIEIK
jgi:DNA/RNA endonuclease YhcR with UshA esterase domain